MSLDFWLEFAGAVTLFVIAIGLVQAHKRGLVRVMRAQWLRRRIVHKLQNLLPMLPQLSTADSTEQYALFRLRADLEALLSKASVLLDDERDNLRAFLTQLSTVFARSEMGEATAFDVDELILLGQRTIHESKEFGY